MLSGSHLPFAFLPNIGWPEAMLIFGVVIIFFGPQRLPEVAEALGKSIRKFKAATRELKTDIESQDTTTPRIDSGKPGPSSPPNQGNH